MPEKYTRPHTHERMQTVERMRRAWEAERDALATVRRFNAWLSAKGSAWFWPKIGAALTARHPWLVIVCDSCGTIMDLDLRVKRATPKLQFALYCATYAALAAMATVARALPRWRVSRRYE